MNSQELYFSRREFLKIAGLSCLGIAVSACSAQLPEVPQITATPSPISSPSSTQIPTKTAEATKTPEPTNTPEATSTPTMTEVPVETIRSVSEAKGLPVGSSVYNDESENHLFTDEPYKKVMSHFAALHMMNVVSPNAVKKYGYKLLENLRDAAVRNNQSVLVTNLFWDNSQPHFVPVELSSLNINDPQYKQKVFDNMAQRLQSIYGVLKEPVSFNQNGQDVTGTVRKPFVLGLNHEALWSNKSGNSSGYEEDSPYQRASG